VATLYSLLFDSRIFATARLNTVSRGGIYRYSSQLLLGLALNCGKDGWPDFIHTYCNDPFLSGFAYQDLMELQEQSAVDLNLSANSAGVFIRDYQPSHRLKRLIKPIYNRLKRTGLASNRSGKQLLKTLQDINAKNIIYHTPFQAVDDAFRKAGLRHIVVTVHDLLPRIHPEYFTNETIQAFNELIDQLQPSDHIVCVSESTKQDLLSLVPKISSSHVYVTPLAADPRMRQVKDPNQLLQVRERLGLGSHDQIILSLCTLEPRKNLATLVEAFSSLAKVAHDSSIKLVLVGSFGWKNSPLLESIRASSVRDQIIITGYIDDSQLGCLYSLADLFVYPSLYEGFGLPPLEAMQCGCCVIAGHTSSLPEVVGDSAILVDPRSQLELQKAMEDMLGSPTKREEIKLRGIKRAQQFSWHKTADLTVKAYQNVLASSAV